MAIREVTTDSKGHRHVKELPGYKSAEPKKLPKLVKPQAKVAVAPKPKVKKPMSAEVKAKLKASRKTRAPFTVTEMTLNGSNFYVPKSKQDAETKEQTHVMFNKWIQGSGPSEFIAVRR